MPHVKKIHQTYCEGLDKVKDFSAFSFQYLTIALVHFGNNSVGLATLIEGFGIF